MAARWPVSGALALAVLALALAGCTGAPPEQAADNPVPAGDAQPGGLVPTDDAANLSQPEDQSEFARSLDEKFHTHNYWGGSLEKLLMDEDVAISQLTPSPTSQESVEAYFITMAVARGPGLTPFSLPEGSIVPPETERLEVTITWASSPTITGLFLAYSAAADANQDITALDPLPEGGGTYTIATNLTMNDMPHTTVSKWRFYLVPDNAATEGTPVDGIAPAVLNGTVRVAIKAFRSDILFVAPPHPDFWGSNTTLALFNHSAPLKGQRVGFPLFLSGLTGENDRNHFLVPPNGTIVPPHTAHLTLTLRWVNNNTLPDPFNTHVELEFRPPNSFGWLAPEGREAPEPGVLVYTIAVDAAMADSPYAEESQWTFLVFLDTDAPTDQGFLGDVGFFDGSYTLTVEAVREAA